MISATRPSVTVLICTLNEAESLPYVLSRIPGWVDEILIIDGHSTDGTREVARRVCPRARVLLQPGQGKGDALRFGIREAQSDIVVTLDADGQTDPEELGKFVAVLAAGYDFAKGTRFRKPFSKVRPIHRIFGNWIITLVFDALFFRGFTDLCSGFNAFWRDVAMKIDLSSADGFADEPLLHAKVAKAGLKSVEIPHHDHPRLGGKSKSPGWRQGFRAVGILLAERLR